MYWIQKLEGQRSEVKTAGMDGQHVSYLNSIWLQKPIIDFSPEAFHNLKQHKALQWIQATIICMFRQ
jgi:hypothetical protein